MDDVLLQLQAARPLEKVTSPEYYWRNRIRTGGSLILQYTFSGKGGIRRGRRLRYCGPGQALLMAEGDHTEYFYPPLATEPWVFCWLNFDGAERLWQTWMRKYRDVVDLDPQGEACSLLQQITRLYQLKSFQDRYHSSDLLGRLLSSMGRELAGVTSASRPAAQRAADILRDHHRRPLNIKELATQVGLSREHLTRLFAREYQQTPAAMLRELRLSTARRLLRHSRMSVAAIAEQSGFGSAVHFCRIFKSRHGMTPLEYRRQSEGYVSAHPA